MEWNEDDKNALLAFKENVDCDDVKIKEQIKQVLLNNRFIIHVLNNKELEENEAEPSDYFGENIRPAYIIPETQTETRNFLCYTVSSYKRELGGNNPTVKTIQIIFYILCHEKDLIDEDTNIARHDLLAALIQDQFNYTTYIGGGKLKLVENTEQVVDNNYVSRVIRFDQTTDLDLVKTKDGVTRFINKEFQKHI